MYVLGCSAICNGGSLIHETPFVKQTVSYDYFVYKIPWKIRREMQVGAMLGRCYLKSWDDVDSFISGDSSKRLDWNKY